MALKKFVAQEIAAFEASTLPMLFKGAGAWSGMRLNWTFPSAVWATWMEAGSAVRIILFSNAAAELASVSKKLHSLFA